MSQRLTIFARGNTDLRDALHGQVVGGRAAWSGINEILRQEKRDCTIRVRHETHTCFAALKAAGGAIPEGLADVSGLLGPFSLQSQFSNAMFAASGAVVALSIQGDLTVPMLRHRRDGYPLHAYNWRDWTAESREWLRENFLPLPAPTAEQSMADLAEVIARVRASGDAPILVFNAVSVTLGETIHCYQGVGEVFSQRVRRFNAALVDASARLGFSIVDVDRIVAEHGARHLIVDPFHLNALGCRKVAEDVVRILEDHGLLPERLA